MVSLPIMLANPVGTNYPCPWLSSLSAVWRKNSCTNTAFPVLYLIPITFILLCALVSPVPIVVWKISKGGIELWVCCQVLVILLVRLVMLLLILQVSLKSIWVISIVSESLFLV